MAAEDVIGSVGVRVVPIVEAGDIKAAVEKAAQQASSSATATINAGTRASAAGAAASAPTSSRPAMIGGETPQAIVARIQEMEGAAPHARDKFSGDILRGAAQAFRGRLRDAGYSYEELVGAPQTAASGGGAGGARGPLIASGGAEDEGSPNRAEPTRRRAARTASGMKDAYGSYLGSTRMRTRRRAAPAAPKTSLLEDAMGGIVGSVARRFRPANQFRMLRAARRVNRLANRDVFSNGMFMNVLFGGSEALGAIQSTYGANSQTEGMGPSAAAARIQLQGYAGAAGGFMGRFANLFIDPMGVKQAAIESTLAGAEAQDAFGRSVRSLNAANRANTQLSPITAVGNGIVSMSKRLGAGIDSANQELDTQLDAARTADKATYDKEKYFWSIYSGEKNKELAKGLEDRRTDADRARREAQALKNQAAVNTAVTEFVRANAIAADDADAREVYVGNPVALARDRLFRQQRREQNDIENPRYRKEFIDTSIKAGNSEQTAQRAYDSMVSAQRSRHYAENGALEAEIRYNSERGIRVANAAAASIRARLADDPYGASRISLSAEYDERRRDSDQSPQSLSALNRQESAERALIDRNESDTRQDIRASNRVQANVLRASIAAGRKERSPLAPRLESIIGGFEQTATGLRRAGMGSEIEGAREVARLEVDQSRAQFFASFGLQQYGTLDEVDTSGKGFDLITKDLADADRRISSTPGSKGLSAVGAIRAVISDITNSEAFRYFRNSNAAMEEQ